MLSLCPTNGRNAPSDCKVYILIRNSQGKTLCEEKNFRRPRGLGLSGKKVAELLGVTDSRLREEFSVPQSCAGGMIFQVLLPKKRVFESQIGFGSVQLL